MPPMGLLTNAAAMAAAVRFVVESAADVTLFAIGAPQSEKLAALCKAEPGSRGIGLCIGASINFVLGRVPRAPRWIQRMGMEWAFRLASEPKRLWRRYLVEGPRVFAIYWRRRRAGLD